MATIRVDLSYQGKDRVLAAVEGVQDAISPPLLTESLGLGAREFESAAQDAAPVESGRLRSSILAVPVDEKTWEVGPRGLVYAAMQHYGGDVQPVTKQFMHFIGANGPVFLKHARIPGTHYMTVGFERGLAPAEEAIKADIIANVEA